MVIAELCEALRHRLPMLAQDLCSVWLVPITVELWHFEYISRCYHNLSDNVAGLRQYCS